MQLKVENSQSRKVYQNDRSRYNREWPSRMIYGSLQSGFKFHQVANGDGNQKLTIVRLTVTSGLLKILLRAGWSIQ